MLMVITTRSPQRTGHHCNGGTCRNNCRFGVEGHVALHLELGLTIESSGGSGKILELVIRAALESVAATGFSIMTGADQEHQIAMTDDNQPAAPPTRDTGALLLAAGGLAAAFGAASCCALPILLGSLGLSSAWLVAVAWVAAPHRLTLLVAAVVCLVGAGGLFIWRRRVAACTPGAACGRPAITILIMGFLPVGAVLVVLGYVYA